MTASLQVGRVLGRGREHRKAAPLFEGSLQRLYPSGVSHLCYQGRDLVQKVAPAPELVCQMGLPNICSGVDAVAGLRVSPGLEQSGLLPLTQSRWSDPQLPREPSDEASTELIVVLAP